MVVKTVLITGSTRGFGLAFVQHYKQLGWKVIGAARNLDTADQLRAAGPSDIIELDTSDEASILRATELLKSEPIDLLINNAGIAVRDSLSRATKADLMKQYEVNAVGPFLVTRALHPSLKAAAAANGHATVANISGIVASIGNGSAFPGLYGYSASKVALNMFHAKLARDLKKDKIISLSFHPGILATDMTAGKGQVQPIAAAATVEKLISGATLQHSGKFLDSSGKELPCCPSIVQQLRSRPRHSPFPHATGYMEADASAVYGTFQGKSPLAASQPGRNWLRVVGVVVSAVAVTAAVTLSWSSHGLGPGLPTVDLGRTMRGQQQELDFEKRFVDGIDRSKLKEYLHTYASKPHPAGSAQDYQTALYTKQQFEKFGLKAEIIEYYPLLSKPRRAPRVAITAPANAARELNLNEPPVDGDVCTTAEDALPPYLAYVGSGNVTAPVVYAHFGRQADFDWLLANGVELKNKIALVRYGGNMRSLKIMLAEQYGMVATLLYSDPQDDGAGVGPTYPLGPWRPADSFQRGSAQILSLYAGDPLTPGFASTKNASYIKMEDATCLLHTPATVLSAAQARWILQSLGGKQAPREWQGGESLPRGYRIGDDGATHVNVDIDLDNIIGTIWDVIGTIDGTDEPDYSVLIGNHRDAWVCGAVDPSSGSSTMLEIARGLGELLQTGWRPRRTIKLASWDGEEAGLLGSTEYVEDHKHQLLQEAVAYINVDLTYGPLISAGGTPSIAEFLLETAKSVPANKFYGNETEATLYEQWVAQSKAARAANPAVEQLTLAPDHLIYFLGSGTDFTAFYQHLGIISANLAFGFGNGAAYGTYHSTMDSPMYLETAADPHYTSQATTAQWWGLLALRLATLPVLPFDFSTYGVAMHKDLSNLEVQTKALKLEIDYSGLRKAIDRFVSKSTKFTKATEKFKAKYDAGKETDKHALELNDKLVRLERQFISEQGLPHRPWFRHVIFGPGFFEGYLGAAFPGIADGIAFKDNATTIQAHVEDVAKIVKGAADFLSTK